MIDPDDERLTFFAKDNDVGAVVIIHISQPNVLVVDTKYTLEEIANALHSMSHKIMDDAIAIRAKIQEN